MLHGFLSVFITSVMQHILVNLTPVWVRLLTGKLTPDPEVWFKQKQTKKSPPPAHTHTHTFYRHTRQILLLASSLQSNQKVLERLCISSTHGELHIMSDDRVVTHSNMLIIYSAVNKQGFTSTLNVIILRAKHLNQNNLSCLSLRCLSCVRSRLHLD